MCGSVLRRKGFPLRQRSSLYTRTVAIESTTACSMRCSRLSIEPAKALPPPTPARPNQYIASSPMFPVALSSSKQKTGSWHLSHRPQIMRPHLFWNARYFFGRVLTKRGTCVDAIVLTRRQAHGHPIIAQLHSDGAVVSADPRAPARRRSRLPLSAFGAKQGLILSQTTAANGATVSKARTLLSAFPAKGEDPVVRCIEDRISTVVGQSRAYMEPLQVTDYTHKQEFRKHHDYFGAGAGESERTYHPLRLLGGHRRAFGRVRRRRLATRSRAASPLCVFPTKGNAVRGGRIAPRTAGSTRVDLAQRRTAQWRGCAQGGLERLVPRPTLRALTSSDGTPPDEGFGRLALQPRPCAQRQQHLVETLRGMGGLVEPVTKHVIIIGREFGVIDQPKPRLRKVDSDAGLLLSLIGLLEYDRAITPSKPLRCATPYACRITRPTPFSRLQRVSMSKFLPKYGPSVV